jgi:hypothetical protein
LFKARRVAGVFRRHVPHDLIERHAEAADARRQIEHLAEFAVPADELEVAVEHRDALMHLVERRLQQIAVVLNGFGGIVQEL